MNENLRIERILEANHPLLKQVERTYNESFPPEERRAFSLVEELIRQESRFEMYILKREGEYVGFITGWQFDGFVYVEHFAIEASARNGGIGAASMRAFLALHKDPVVLEVEMPMDEMSERRIGFYKRLGYTLDEQIYFQPPYRKGESSLEMRLMSYGPLNLPCTFGQVTKIIHEHVYGVK